MSFLRTVRIKVRNCQCYTNCLNPDFQSQYDIVEPPTTYKQADESDEAITTATPNVIHTIHFKCEIIPIIKNPSISCSVDFE